MLPALFRSRRRRRSRTRGSAPTRSRRLHAAQRAAEHQARWLIDTSATTPPTRIGHGCRSTKCCIARSDCNVLYLGDAAHGMVPTLGQGATQAMEDAANAAALITQRYNGGNRDVGRWLEADRGVAGRADALRDGVFAFRDRYNAGRCRPRHRHRSTRTRRRSEQTEGAVLRRRIAAGSQQDLRRHHDRNRNQSAHRDRPRALSHRDQDR